MSAGGSAAIVDEWQRRGRVLEIAGERVFVIDEAAHAGESGDPLLVLHGFPTCSLDWSAVLPSLAEHRRVVLLDFPGYGLSDKPDRPYSLFGQADVVETVARELALERVVLVTHDMGASVGGEVLARAIEGTLGFDVSQRVQSNGSVYLELAHLTDGQQLLESLPDEALPEGAGPDADALVAALTATLAPDASVDPTEMRALAELVVRAGGNRLLPRLIRYLHERREHEARWTGAIERHPSPLAVIWGDADPIAVWPMVERLQAVRPDVAVTRLRGVGHYPMFEAPDAFASAAVGALGR